VAYDPAQVVGLHVAMGFATTVQFPPDERIETVTLGDSAAWLVQTNKRADSLIVKPLAGGNTNLTVLTDTRAYNFTLYTAWPGEGVQPYLLSFTFPRRPCPKCPARAGATRFPATRRCGRWKCRTTAALPASAGARARCSPRSTAMMKLARAAERRDARWRLCGGRRLCAAAVCGGKARARARRQGEARP
jgi:hypothetical protein